MYSFWAWYSFRMSFWSVPPRRPRAAPGCSAARHVHGEEDGRRRVDRHRRRHRPQVDPGEEVLRVGQRVDGHAAPSYLALGERIVGVTAHERGKVERHRQPPASRPEQLAKRTLVSSAVPKPANRRMVQSFERYIEACGPRVKGGHRASPAAPPGPRAIGRPVHRLEPDARHRLEIGVPQVDAPWCLLHRARPSSRPSWGGVSMGSA